MPSIWEDLGLTWTDAWLIVVTATGIYLSLIAFSRLATPRQWARSSSYDLAFTFAMGTLVGRAILVRTTLAAAVVGLATMFFLHSGIRFLHHRSSWLHRALENKPVLLVAHGEVLEDNLRKAHTSRMELHAELRQKGFGSLDDVDAVVLEKSGQYSVIAAGKRLDTGLFDDVVGQPTRLG